MTRMAMAYPVDGRLILQPDLNFQPFPDEGRRVPLDMFYQRAISQGDLTLTPPAAPEPVAAPATTKQKAASAADTSAASAASTK